MAAWRDLIDVRTTLRGYATDVLERLDRPPSGARTLRVGPRPIRILLIGAGAAVGYGVTTSEHALDGAIADAVHEATGRGVSVVNRAVPGIRLDRVAASMGAARAHTFDALVWAPTYAEVVERLGAGSWRRELTALVTDVQTETPVRMALLLLPHPMGGGAAGVLARSWLPRINRVIEQVAAASPRTTAVPVAPVEMAAVGEVVADREYYVRCAALLLPTLLGEVGEARTGS